MRETIYDLFSQDAGGGSPAVYTPVGTGRRFFQRVIQAAAGLIGLSLAVPLVEYYVIQGDFYTTGKYRQKGHHPFDMEKAIDEHPTYIVFNGAEGALMGDKALKEKVGDRIRLFVGNGGPNLVSSFHAPGAASEIHFHPGSVFAYVLEGTVVSQLEGDEPMTYTKGQSWYESPKQPHVVSKNASMTEPAKLLVFLFSQEGESIKLPMTSLDAGR